MRSLASGTTADDDRWDLQVGAGKTAEAGPALMLYVDTIAGYHMGGGSGDFRLHGRPIAVATSVGDKGPRGWIVLADKAVARVRVTLSSGATYEVELHAAPELGRNRAGVVIFPRNLDVHRLDSFDLNGSVLDEPIPIVDE
jgi:hypothetical protein